MRRKAGAGRPPPEIGQITPARALRQAVAQAAQDVARLVAVAGAVEEARTTLGPVEAALPDAPLLALVEGTDSRFGLVVLDGQAVAALIEMQTTGRVVPRPAAPRAPTRTDAIMCADFIDRTLELVEARLGEANLPDAPVFSGFRYAMALPDPRAISMTLEDVPYRKLSLTVDFGHGAKSGEIAVILPYDPPGQRPDRGDDGTAFTTVLREQVFAAEAQLSVTLARRKMTVAEVAGLAVGSVIALPQDALAKVAIEDIDGRVVARGRLGQAEGHRAVRVREGLAATPGGAAPGPASRRAPLHLESAGGTAAIPAPGAVSDPGDDLAALASLGGGGDGDSLPMIDIATSFSSGEASAEISG